ncbi:DNA-nicking Smr family endonuclease [Kerstersia gyiorum]|uniref:DNA-nicking Smr family endonuclease n=1 Tax=Kerstersia gyiorum TaxID=206506 RepID=A0A4Q7N093_9BURK|nr:Smr/MutS family protein [Kerstersia gyiorum]KAB0542651.1 DNA mismatch repair protein MutS [Kerstersia gyiorum]RZS73875.1 DNA-nicking Smr family endonuclease [Kerstersia gyiorum]
MSTRNKPLKGNLEDLKRLHQQARERDEQLLARQRLAARQTAAAAPSRAADSRAADRATAAAQAAARQAARPAVQPAAPGAKPEPAAETYRPQAGEDDFTLLLRSMAGVTPIRQGRDVNTRVYRAAPSDEQLRKRQAAAGVTTLEEAHIPAPAVSDEYIAARLIENGTAYLRAGMAPDTIKRLRRGKWPFRAEIDLHGMTVDNARQALLPFLAQSRIQGHRGVRVIHGKGLGSPEQQPVLREKVKTWLVQYPDVQAFAQGREADGGAGAVLVLLSSLDGTHDDD